MPGMFAERTLKTRVSLTVFSAWLTSPLPHVMYFPDQPCSDCESRHWEATNRTQRVGGALTLYPPLTCGHTVEGVNYSIQRVK